MDINKVVDIVCVGWIYFIDSLIGICWVGWIVGNIRNKMWEKKHEKKISLKEGN